MPLSNGTNTVDKLDFPSGPNERTRLLNHSVSIESFEDDAPQSARSGRFFEHVAEGIQERDKQRFKREAIRYISFIWALVCCGCAGSISAYSLYGPLFQTRLGYTQYQVNIVSVIAEIAIYLPVPIFGFLIDNYSPRPVLFLAGLTFGFGYIIAAFTYKSGPPETADGGGDGWPFGVMVLAFIGIGMGTSCMHLSGMSACAKNFNKSKFKGVALAAPIAAFGLSGLWQSQVGSHFLYERNEDGTAGPLDVFRYFIFLGSLLGSVGFIGAFVMRIVDEDELIEEAIEEMERSGLLEDSTLFRPRSREPSYGTVDQDDHDTAEDAGGDSKRIADENAMRKSLLLKSETKLFLTDRTMWLLTAGFYLVSGPGEAFINNLGTLIGTLYPSPADTPPFPNTLYPTTPATHVSIFALTSTIARLVTGALSDLLAPSVSLNQHRRGPASLTSSLASLDPLAGSVHSIPQRSRFTISRVSFLLTSSILLSLGAALLASGGIQDHAADRFWLISAAFGLGYGSAFTLVPILVSSIWGVENFGTNLSFILVTPALGAATWGAIYSTEYESASKHNKPGDWGKCYGLGCYRITFWTMAVGIWIACALWIFAWKGPGGWRKRGILI